jgi:hypothetical protein
VAQVVEGLPNKLEALSSILITSKKQKLHLPSKMQNPGFEPQHQDKKSQQNKKR